MLTATEFKLSPAEMRLIQAYRGMCEAKQQMLVGTAESCAERDTKARKAVPVLRLLQGGTR